MRNHRQPVHRRKRDPLARQVLGVRVEPPGCPHGSCPHLLVRHDDVTGACSECSCIALSVSGEEGRDGPGVD